MVVQRADERSAPSRTSGPTTADHSHDIYTLANIITVLRLMLVPIFFAVLLSGRSDTVAFVLFATAASTDWLDGQIARRTGTVTVVGRAIDPLVDRLLIASGVLGVYLEGRIPLWILVLLLLRDVYLLAGASWLVRAHVAALPVMFLGKLTTALLLLGFSDLILNWPNVPGIAVLESSALPGWGSQPAVVGVWFVYAGIVLSLLTALLYTRDAHLALSRARARGRT